MISYTVGALLGQGKFGVVYEGTTKKDNRRVAIKMEKSDCTYKVLKHEATVLNYLYRCGVACIPKIYWFGQHLGNTCLVMSYFSTSLHEYILCKGPYSVVVKCLDIIEHIHRHHILHRDLKPQNFMINDGDLYLIDFGLSTVFMDDEGNHIHKADNHHIIGSPKYVSYYNHCGEPMGRRDDLLSLGYMFMYIENGVLPWDCASGGETSICDPANIVRRDQKAWHKLSDYLYGPIRMYMKYCYELKYDEKPNYRILMELFTQTFA